MLRHRCLIGRHAVALAASALVLGLGGPAAPAQETQRRNLFGMHNLKDGGPAIDEGMEWTRRLVGRGFVFDWVTDIEPWIETAFGLDLVPCIRVQDGRGGTAPNAGYAENVAWRILNYKIAHPQYADRLVYLQLWNEPNDQRDYVRPSVYADYLVAAHSAIHRAESLAAAEHPGLGLEGTLKTMTPGQNGPSWWDEAFLHNPDAKFAFDVWGTHPYPEASPPHYNLHDGDVFIETSKTIDSYLMDLDVVARPHGTPPRSRRGFPVMITETAYGNKLGISYEGWPKTTRGRAADYNVDAFRNRWYRWPEILAVHPFLLSNLSWENFAWVSSGGCDGPPPPSCASVPDCSLECDGDGLREPKTAYPQYEAVRQLRVALEGEGMAPARLAPHRGATGTVKGRVSRADTGAPLPYATVRSDGYAVGHVSLYDGLYEIHDVPVGTYDLTAEKNGFRAARRTVTVAAGQTVTADFDLTYTGRVSKGLYFVDSPPNPGCPGCQLFASFLGQTFTTPADVGFVKYAAAKPHVDDVTLRFSILDGGPQGAPVGPSMTATLDKGDGANMIGGEWPDGQEPVVQPNHAYFLKIERADGQGIYIFASNANPYAGGNAYVGTQSLPGVDLNAVIRGLTTEVNAAVGSLQGYVRDTGGVGIGSATVTTDPGSRTATTDSTGRYTLSGVAVGIYRVSASRSGYLTASRTGVEVRQDQTTSLDFQLEAGTTTTGAIGGTIRDTSGRPLSGAEVTASPGGARALNDSNGNYELAGLTPGTYGLAVAKAGYVSQTRAGVAVAAGETTTESFDLAPVPVALAWSTEPFEDFVYQSGFGQIPRSWSAWYENASPASPGSREWNIVAGESGWAQELRKSNVRVGLYRANSGFAAGQSYRVGLRAKWLSGGSSSPSCSLGLHPTAGTDPSGVTWAPGVPVVSKASWTDVQGTFTVPNPSATVFVRCDFGGLVDYGVAVDDLSIQAVSGPTPGNQPPTVSLATDRASAAFPGSFVLSATASDPDGSVAKVDFFQGATLLGTDTTSPYSWTWTGVPAGSYSLTARAQDDAGAATVSNAVSVSVGSAPPPPPPPPPPSGKSKLSIHAGWGGFSEAFIRDAKPRVVKLFDEVKNAALVKQLSPGTLVVGRLFPGSVPDGVLNNGSPVDRANDWWSTVKATVLAYPEVDYWEGLNEPVVTSAPAMSWYAQFEIARLDILAANGRKAAIGNFATGNPDLALWPGFVPAIDHALAKGGILGLHEYGTPMTQYWDEAAGEGWLCGRYRKVYRQHLQGREIPLVITETGVDEGALASSGPGQPKPRPIDAQANHGWQQAIGTPPVAGVPAPGDLAARKPWYLAQLQWYDGVLREDAYVLGATTYQLEIPGWGSFDLRPLVPELTDYVSEESANAPPAVSLASDRASAVAPGSFVLSAAASDPDGSVARVEFYSGTTLIGTDTAPAFSLAWSGVAAGTYSLTARAYDDAGATATSNAVSVSVTSVSAPTADPGLVWLSDDMDAHDGQLVRRWAKWWTGGGSTEWNVVPGEGGWAQEVKKTNVNVGISRPNRGFKPGDTYRVRYRARRTTGSGSVSCYAGVQPSGGALVWSAPVPVSSATSWVDVSYPFTASAWSTTLFLRADLTGFADAGVAFDNVSVELLSPREPEPWMASGAPPVEPRSLHGIHDAGAEDVFVQAGRGGWVTEALAIGSDPNDLSGRRFTQWIDGIGVVGRIAHAFGAILPPPGPAPQYPGLDAFARRAANFAKASTGCGLWSIGNEPHLEGAPDPVVYAEAFCRAYRAIKAERPEAKVLTAGFVHGDLDYMKAALAGIESRGVLPDGIALHTYTDSQGWNESSFRDYQLKIANLPASMRALPLYITEAGTGGPGNPTTNTGLVDAMFRHVHMWNASGGQQVRAVCLYRWAAGTDKWAIETNPGMRADFVATLSKDYRWFP